jgi:RNA polymerase sigma factor for flagellar operon FliA
MERDKKEQLVLQHYNMVKYMALRLASRLPNNISADDLFNTGIIGLIDAIDKFDKNQGIQFETYARIRIRGAMLDEIRAMDWIPRSLRQKSSEIEKTCLALEQKLGHYPSDEEVASEMGISLNDYYKMLDDIKGISLLPEDIHEILSENRGSHSIATESDELFKQAYRGELRRHLSEAIEGLSKKEQLVLSFYYFEELTMKEIGLVMGYTESRISQIHTKAILRLRTRLARKFKTDDLPDHVQRIDIGA